MRGIGKLSAPALEAFRPLLLEWKDRIGLQGEDARMVAAAKMHTAS